MKTRLLLLFLFTISMVSTAQFSVNEGFESGSRPGWTSNLFAVFSGYIPCSGSFAMSKVHSASSPNGEFATVNYNSNGRAISFAVNYKLTRIGSFAASVQVQVYYTVNNSASTAIASINAPAGASCSAINFTIPAGTVPNGSQIKFHFGGNRISGDSNLMFDNISIVQQAITISNPTIIANYPFNNTYLDTNGINTFSTPSTNFVTDRNNTATAAIQVNSASVSSSAVISNLPVGNSERTVSVWHKKPVHSVAVGLFSYGTIANGRNFGLYLDANGNYVIQGSTADVSSPGSATVANTWVNSVVTFKNGLAKLYTNGTFVRQSTVDVNTENKAFKLGGNGAIVEFDDLQIYNYELSAAQVGELYNNNSLSSSDFSTKNLKVSLYPNPVKDILNIETATEIKSVAIYNLLGQKVKTAKSKNINVSDLSNGTYMVRVQDTNNAVETMKIIKQ